MGENNETRTSKRDRVIIRTSLIAILANVALAGFKVFLGLLSNSIAIILDAVNNLSDAFSSLITIIGMRLAGKQPDKKHPYGYGRIEYLSATAISFIVLYAGISSLIESVKKILHPEAASYGYFTLVFVAVAVIVKITLGRYVKRTGEKVRSDALVNSGQDAVLDSVISASTLVAAILYLVFGIQLEAWLGAVISGVIIKSGIDMLCETLSRILGERIEGSLGKEIKRTITSVDGILGAYDLILHDYGPDRMLASVHIEVPDYYSAAEIDEKTRDITQAVYANHNIITTAVGIYSRNTKNDEISIMREAIRRTVMAHEHVLQMHGFYADANKKQIRFDLVIDFLAKNRGEIFETICQEIRDDYPTWTFSIVLDSDFTD